MELDNTGNRVGMIDYALCMKMEMEMELNNTDYRKQEANMCKVNECPL